MSYLSPPTLTRTEIEAILAITRNHPRDHLIIALALGTGLRLGEIVGLDVGDVYLPDGTPRTRVRLRAEIANGGRVGDVFLPDAAPEAPAVQAVQGRSSRITRPRRPALLQSRPTPDLEA